MWNFSCFGLFSQRASDKIVVCSFYRKRSICLCMVLVLTVSSFSSVVQIPDNLDFTSDLSQNKDWHTDFCHLS